MSTLIPAENITTGDCPAETGINAPDRSVMLMLRSMKGDQPTDDDDVTRAES